MGEVRDAEILAAFLASEGDYVSGATIAEDTGVSRAAVWGRLERLRSEGFAFEAVRNKGYRLETIPEVLHPALLAAHLLRLACPANLHFLTETDSTNSQAERLLAEGEHTPFVVVAGAADCRAWAAWTCVVQRKSRQPDPQSGFAAATPTRSDADFYALDGPFDLPGDQ